MKPIFLIGFPGCGKSTLCRCVKDLIDIEVVDLDDLITERIGMSIREYFAANGEEAFRKIERQTLIDVSEKEDVIIACGGGVPCYFDNMEVMNAVGTTIWLEASESILFSRLARGRHKRPLIAAMNDDELMGYIRTTLQNRAVYYSKAHHRFSTSLLETETERSQTARRFVEQFGFL